MQERVKWFADFKILWSSNVLTLQQTSPSFMRLQYKSFQNIVGKGEIVCNDFLTVFSIYLENFL